jgi:hypothetical protein
LRSSHEYWERTMAVEDFLNLDNDFNLLSLRDLLAAREQFHLHLIHKQNVVATAVGRYRIRKSDPWPDRHNPSGDPKAHGQEHPVRTLSNSEVRPYSWPAILVFVERWVQADDFEHPEDSVPPAVYMPNGQKVPICVVQVDKDDVRPEADAHYSYPASVMGGGYPVICDVQGREHVASVACLVTDGNKTFALTNRHVAGEPGTRIGAIVGGNKIEIGTTAPVQLSRVLFKDLYPGWGGDNVYVDLDVGLIEVDDVNQWTTQVYGVGEIGPLADLDVSNISLRLIGCPVRAHGAASGDMRGEICALFYRFKSVGGFEYVADALIGPGGSRIQAIPGRFGLPIKRGTNWDRVPCASNGAVRSSSRMARKRHPMRWRRFSAPCATNSTLRRCATGIPDFRNTGVPSAITASRPKPAASSGTKNSRSS